MSKENYPESQLLRTFRIARKVMIFVIGISILAFGIALAVLPGPAFIVVPIGLGILATEFLWARRLLRQLKTRALQVFNKPAKLDGPEAKQ